MHETLRYVVAERTDPLAVELGAKLSYASCIHAEKTKYRRDCMQRFLSGVTVIQSPVNYKHFAGSKNDGFNNFCDWHESSNHDTTSSFTLFEVQKLIEDNNNEEVYSISHLSGKLSERYGAEGSKVQLTQRAGLTKIMLLQEEANSIVTDTILDSSVGAAAKIVKDSLRDGHKTELTEGSDRFYPYPNELSLEKLTVEAPAPLKTFFDIMYSKSRIEAAEKKKKLRKIASTYINAVW